jgi:hypothetical protein
MSIHRAVAVCAVSLALSARAPAQHAATPVVLDNGVRIVAIPVAGATRVAVEVVHHVGSLHEPAGMPQTAHLVEHLVCFGATGSLKQGEAFATGTARGSTNAETLADVTRYEHEAPAADLERILRLEADRLRAVAFTPELLAQEAPRIDQEFAFVEASPMAPLLKYAFVAAPQAWFHARSEAALSAAVGAYDLAIVSAWQRQWYRPETTTIVMVGGFDEAAAVALARATLGQVPRGQQPPAALDYTRVPRRSSVKWTSRHKAVIVAFEPPPDPVDRLTLTVLSEVVLEQLARDPQVQRLALVTMTSNRSWPVGVGDGAGLPLFLYATVRPDADALEAERVLTERFVSLLTSAAESGMHSVAIASLIAPAMPTWEQAQAQGKQIFASRPGFAGDPGGTVLLFHALQVAAHDRVFSPTTALGAARALTAAQAKAIVERTTDPARKFVTTLAP